MSIGMIRSSDVLSAIVGGLHFTTLTVSLMRAEDVDGAVVLAEVVDASVDFSPERRARARSTLHSSVL